MRGSSKARGLVVGILGIVALIPPAAGAMQVLHADATYEHGVFRMRFEALLAAPVADVAAVLGDYANYGKLDARIRRVELLGTQPDGVVLMHTRIAACAGFFCRTVERVERIEREPSGQVAVVVPEFGNIRRGTARTHWQQQGAGTVVNYDVEFEPAFWVPGLIAQRFGIRELRESTLKMFESVEREANVR